MIGGSWGQWGGIQDAREERGLKVSPQLRWGIRR